jgi:hypothetical protein
MRKICAIPALLLLALLPESPAVAQFVGIPTTVTQLPTCTSGRNGRIWIVRDGQSMVDCSVGGASPGTIAVCVCSNLTFVPLAAATVEDLSASYVPITKAGQQTLTASGAGNDFTGTVADDWILSIADDYSAACVDYLVSPTTSAVFDVAAGADELTIATGVSTFTGMARLTPQATPPAACGAGTEGGLYLDSDTHLLCVCNATGWVQVADGTTGCS